MSLKCVVRSNVAVRIRNRECQANGFHVEYIHVCFLFCFYRNLDRQPEVSGETVQNVSDYTLDLGSNV